MAFGPIIGPRRMAKGWTRSPHLDGDRVDSVRRRGQQPDLLDALDHRPKAVVDGSGPSARPGRALDEELTSVDGQPGWARHPHRADTPAWFSVGLLRERVARSATTVAGRIAVLDDPVFRLPAHAVVVPVQGQHYEVVDGHRRDLGVKLDHHLPLGGVDGRLVLVSGRDAYRLRPGEPVRRDLRRGLAAVQLGRPWRLERLVDRQTRAEYGGDHDARDQDGDPGSAAPCLREIRALLFGDYGRAARRRLGLAHFLTAASAIAWTSPCVVYSRATMLT